MTHRAGPALRHVCHPPHRPEVRHARVDIAGEDQHPHLRGQVLLVQLGVGGHRLRVVEVRLGGGPASLAYSCSTDNPSGLQL